MSFNAKQRAEQIVKGIATKAKDIRRHVIYAPIHDYREALFDELDLFGVGYICIKTGMSVQGMERCIKRWSEAGSPRVLVVGDVTTDLARSHLNIEVNGTVDFHVMYSPYQHTGQRVNAFRYLAAHATDDSRITGLETSMKVELESWITHSYEDDVEKLRQKIVNFADGGFDDEDEEDDEDDEDEVLTKEKKAPAKTMSPVTSNPAYPAWMRRSHSIKYAPVAIKAIETAVVTSNAPFGVKSLIVSDTIARADYLKTRLRSRGLDVAVYKASDKSDIRAHVLSEWKSKGLAALIVVNSAALDSLNFTLDEARVNLYSLLPMSQHRANIVFAHFKRTNPSRPAEHRAHDYLWRLSFLDPASLFPTAIWERALEEAGDPGAERRTEQCEASERQAETLAPKAPETKAPEVDHEARCIELEKELSKANRDIKFLTDRLATEKFDRGSKVLEHMYATTLHTKTEIDQQELTRILRYMELLEDATKSIMDEPNLALARHLTVEARWVVSTFGSTPRKKASSHSDDEF